MMNFEEGIFSLDTSKFDKNKNNFNNNEDRRNNNTNQAENRPASKNNKNNNNNSNKPRLNVNFNFDDSLSDFGKKPNMNNKTRKEKVEADPKTSSNQVAIDKAILDDFVESYVNNKADVQHVNDLLRTRLIDVADIMANYYNRDYDDAIESMNNVLKLMTTRAFSVNLQNYVKVASDNLDTWSTDKGTIGWLISLVIETNEDENMTTETVNTYIDIITEYIWSFEIEEISKRFRLPEDAAIDLVINIPHFGRAMSKFEVQRVYQAYINMLINYGADAIEYLNAENQKQLFYYLFPDVERTAIYAATQCLGDELLTFEEEESEALYNEYVNMLYSIIDEHELEDIKSTLRYIVKRRAQIVKDNTGTVTIFDTEKAVNYDNIRKAVISYVERSADAKTYLDKNWYDKN